MSFIARLFNKQVPVNASSDGYVPISDSAAYAAYQEAFSQITPLQMAAVLRAIDLSSGALAMLPARIVERGTRTVVDHELTTLIDREPNNWQTAFEFKKLMEMRRLEHGESFARIIKLGRKPIALQPLTDAQVETKQDTDWTMRYRVTRADGSPVEVPASDILHLRDLSLDGDKKLSRTKLACEVIATARKAELAQRRMFENGRMAGGWLSVDGELSDKAYERLRTDFEKNSGPEGAGKWIIGEGGATPQKWAVTGMEAQTAEARSHQIEEIARIFGIPRPLLMMDDTSWGSGVEQLATLYVRFGLAPTMIAWEQALTRSLLSRSDKRSYEVDFDERVLLRGSLKDQADFYAKASGAGGHRPWLHRDEIRRDTGEPPLTDEQKPDMEPTNGKTKSSEAA